MAPLPLIQPVTVTRDEHGMFWHPELPAFEEGDEKKSQQWTAEQGLTIRHAALEDADEPIADRYFESNDPDCSYWEPQRPEGEGWFCLAISDTDDGPVCWWARRAEVSA